MRIRASTRLLAVAGDPIGHSLSPAMHNAAIAALGLDAVYLALRAAPDAFPTVVRGLAAAGADLNVTVPHKRAAAALLDVPSDLVRRTGACNIVWSEYGALSGDNTDVPAVAREAAALSRGVPVRRALVLGTGGSARAAAVGIADAWPGAEIAVGSRDAGRGEAFATWAGEAGVGCRVWGVEDSGTVDLVVNATPLGLAAADPLPIEAGVLARLHPFALLDLVYAPGETGLVRAARELGIGAADGRGVLVAQGAASFERFFGVRAPTEIMRATVEDALRA
jgi:shikimate dehydrogenase